MYKVYLDKILLPIAPKSISIGFKSQNKTLTLINEGEINMLKSPGLLDIEFECVLPNSKYPFAVYEDGFVSADKIIDKLNKLKTDKKPFQFIITRTKPNGVSLFNTNIKVSLESYEFEDNADEGFDIKMSISLKQYKDFGVKKIKIEKPDNSEEIKAEEVNTRPADPERIMIGSNVILNGRLHRDSYGKGPGQTRKDYRGKVNLINDKGSHPYHVTTPEGAYLGWVTRDSVKGV